MPAVRHKEKIVFRIRLITVALLLVALVLIGRLYHLQVVEAGYFKDKAEGQYVHTVDTIYDRGTIFFTTKDEELIAAASIKNGYVLAVNPSVIGDTEEVYDLLASHISIDRDTFLHRATLPNRTYVEIEDRLTESSYKNISEAEVKGIYLYKNRWRYYPGDTLSARTVGFVGYAGKTGDETPTGRYGLERHYEKTLARDTDSLLVNFFAEIFSNLGSRVFSTNDVPKADIVTSLEPTVSRMLQKQLLDTNEKYNSTVTGGIIMDPHTGEIIALDAVPTFDLNDRSGATIKDFQNPLIENVYEFGSIIKALTMAAGLDSGAVSRSTTYFDAGKLELDTFTIGNFDGVGRGTVDMQEVLNQSLNTGVAHIVDIMGKNKFRKYFKALKLGSETGIDLPNEAKGLVDNLDSPRDIEYATASFGQGIATTPIAATRALATLANGGVLVTPHIVKSIEHKSGSSKQVHYPEGARVFKESTSEEISKMLATVVDEALQHGEVALPNHSIAAKTGTAQIADRENGGYYDDRYLHSFFGYFPAYDPQFLVFLYTVEPKNVRYASETLTDPFMDITKFLINYYSIPPDR